MVQVTRPKGAFCQLDCSALVGLHPAAVFEVMCDTGNKRIFRNAEVPHPPLPCCLPPPRQDRSSTLVMCCRQEALAPHQGRAVCQALFPCSCFLTPLSLYVPLGACLWFLRA